MGQGGGGWKAGGAGGWWVEGWWGRGVVGGRLVGQGGGGWKAGGAGGGGRLVGQGGGGGWKAGGAGGWWVEGPSFVLGQFLLSRLLYAFLFSTL